MAVDGNSSQENVKTNKGGKMSLDSTPQKIWKRTNRLITLESIETAISEIQAITSWSVDAIEERLCNQKMLIRLPEAMFHLYRDCLS
jgi:hypothetical protein